MLMEAPLLAAMKSRLKQNRNSFLISAKIQFFTGMLPSPRKSMLIHKTPPESESHPKSQLSIVVCQSAELGEFKSFLDIQ